MQPVTATLTELRPEHLGHPRWDAPHKRAVVLGCGPAGLLAAHALVQHGWQSTVLSVKRKSQLGGAQFLHVPIPELTASTPDVLVRYVVRGDVDTYARKVYGALRPTTGVSFSNVHDGMRQSAWNMRRVYDQLWSTWEPVIVATRGMLGPMDLLDAYFTQGWQDQLVVSTVPLSTICMAPEVHRFREQQVRVWAGMMRPLSDATIEYDGTDDVSWYRQSNLWGSQHTEWGRLLLDKRLPVSGAYDVSKPLDNMCSCWPTIVRAGRYGKWTKGVLAHHAYEEISDALHNL